MTMATSRKTRTEGCRAWRRIESQWAHQARGADRHLRLADEPLYKDHNVSEYVNGGDGGTICERRQNVGRHERHGQNVGRQERYRNRAKQEGKVQPTLFNTAILA
jgi:hypothetical protein